VALIEAHRGVITILGILLPLGFGFISLELWGERPHFPFGRIAMVGILSAWVVSWITFLEILSQGAWHWGATSWPIPWGFTANRLTGLMVLYVTSVSGLIHLYALRYMRGEPGAPRFIGRLSLATLSVVFVVLANNLVMLWFFWVLTGITILWLMAYSCANPWTCPTTRRALLTFVVGDLGLAITVILARFVFGTVYDAALFQRLPRHPVAALVLALSIFLAIMARSAQFPLYFWLTNTVDAPTPLSAFMHAGVVNIGGFLLARFSPLWTAVPAALPVIFVVGLVTAFFGNGVMLTQSDVKRYLVYSTVGQMGFMVMEAGLGAFSTAVFHIMSHGLFKATLFLRSGNVSEPSSPTRAPSSRDRRVFLGGLGLTVLIFLLSRPLWPRVEPAILVVFVTATLAQAALVTLKPAISPLAKLAVGIGFVGILVAYLKEIEWFTHFLAGTITVLPHIPGEPIDWIVFSLVAGFSLLTAVLAHESHRKDWRYFYRLTIYSWLLHEGYLGDWVESLIWPRAKPPGPLS